MAWPGSETRDLESRVKGFGICCESVHVSKRKEVVMVGSSVGRVKSGRLAVLFDDPPLAAWAVRTASSCGTSPLSALEMLAEALAREGVPR
jgi:hypothetical protein